MKVVDIGVEKLKAYEKNPRKNDKAVKYVANSIKEFGFKVPIVISENFEIVCGHTRVKAANMLGLKKVPCIIADDLTDEQLKAFRLAENKVGELANWDMDLLIEELAGIYEFDMGDFGFAPIEDIDLDISAADALDIEAETKEKPVKTCRCPKCGFEFEV